MRLRPNLCTGRGAPTGIRTTIHPAVRIYSQGGGNNVCLTLLPAAHLRERLERAPWRMSASLVSIDRARKRASTRPGSPPRRRSWAPGRGADRERSGAREGVGRRASRASARTRRGPTGSRVRARRRRVRAPDRPPRARSPCRPRRCPAGRPRAHRPGSRPRRLADRVGQRRAPRVAADRSHVALGEADRAHAGGDVEVGARPGGPTTYSVLPPPMSITRVGPAQVASGRGAEEGQPRLLLAGDRADVEPVPLADPRLELLAVGGIAHGARGHRDRPRRRARPRARGRREACEDPLHRVVRKPARASTPSPSRVTSVRRSIS